jgi:hypothetical protein
MQSVETEYDKWLKTRSPRRILIEELSDKFYDARRELWQVCPCPKCGMENKEHKDSYVQNGLLLLPGKFFDGEKVVICDKCKGNGFFIDWEKEL